MFRKGKKRHSSSSSQSSEISTKSKSVDSSLGGLSRSSTVASLDTDSTKSSGQSNSNLDTCAEFRIKYVGAIEKLKLSEGKSLEGPLDLINYIDVAQQDGKLPFVPMEEEFIMGVSKYGIKVSTSDQYDVLHRHALYLIVRMVCYDDGLGAGRSLLALKTTDAGNEECSLWVYQCSSLVRGRAARPVVRPHRGKAGGCCSLVKAGEMLFTPLCLKPGKDPAKTVSKELAASCPD
ncbi:integrin subunit beta 1 binding protein 1 [Phyllostomus discolor]|uniref:Integrin beta-1-binding protein 1 n=1 Tax=Phyllostomus discolor TaxID=89673 RepID=A0A834A3D4_9CHIR|nr:integrin subunit beta 1 binding protein 1 [Phyllostomus discolor]